MYNRETGWMEANVDINGTRLTFAQAVSLRVAVTNFRMSMQNPECRRLLGMDLARGYDQNLQEVEQLMLQTPEDADGRT